ncbi:hypothetical protein ALFP_2379 [Alcaligenes faecalis]|nr:hypothetical protein ALFP_2379 [Alcaligenes faecalis]
MVHIASFNLPRMTMEDSFFVGAFFCLWVIDVFWAGADAPCFQTLYFFL